MAKDYGLAKEHIIRQQNSLRFLRYNCWYVINPSKYEAAPSMLVGHYIEKAGYELY